MNDNAVGTFVMRVILYSRLIRENWSGLKENGGDFCNKFGF